MNTVRSQYKGRLLVYAGFLLLLAISFLLMPAASARPEPIFALTLTVGAVFWIGLIGTVVMTVRLRSFGKKHGARTSSDQLARKNGMIRFFQNREAIVANVVTLLSLLGGIPIWILASHSYWGFVFLSLLVFSFGACWVLNGHDYNYMIYHVKGDEK